MAANSPRKKKPAPSALDRYREKRNAGRTSEPFGARGERPFAFVVQKHDARRLHYDFRLELDGVLVSWAVPHGPSLDPTDKRLAVHVEDHPLDYADFEGVIPEGNYGAGPVIVWDKGSWTPIEDPRLGLQNGKLLFDLFGYKLGGRWTLVRIKDKKGKSRGRDWLLIKKADAYARQGEQNVFGQQSVLSGLTLDERGDIGARLQAVRTALRASVPRGEVRAQDQRPMLAEARERAFSDPGWLYEIKYDGFRLFAERRAPTARLFYRSGNESTPVFPEIVAALAALPYDSVVLDGEVVVLDDHGRPSFSGLQERALLRKEAEIARAAVKTPVVFFVFDLLALEGHDLRQRPLVERKALLAQVVPHTGPIRFADHILGQGEAFFAEAVHLGLEGVVAKRLDSTYVGRRSPAWRKIKREHTGDFVIVGFTPPKGARAGLGGLHLAVRGGDQLVYAGRVGSGLGDAELARLRARLDDLETAHPPCVGAQPAGGDIWVLPQLVCEVRFFAYTKDGVLRHPVFLRLRPDKTPDECVREPSPERAERHRAEPATEASDPPAATTIVRQVPFTNLAKVFWPEQRYTKGDLIEFYRAIAPWLLPYLRDRPLVMTRYPDGITGKSFFQKDAPAWAPGWLRTERMWSEHAAREIDYFVCDDVESLLYVVNMGTIALHTWSSRVSDLAKPDFCILDLDPKSAPFAHVIKLARAAHDLCRDLGLPSYVKTSGSTGLHVLIPLGGQLTHDESKQLAELLASVLAREHSDIATTLRTLGRRQGRVYVDFLQNGHGKLLVAPFSVRPLPHAPVSTPLSWRDVKPGLTIGAHNLRTVVQRFRRRKTDPLLPVLDERPDLLGALTKLAERASSTES